MRCSFFYWARENKVICEGNHCQYSVHEAMGRADTAMNVFAIADIMVESQPAARTGPAENANPNALLGYTEVHAKCDGSLSFTE